MAAPVHYAQKEISNMAEQQEKQQEQSFKTLSDLMEQPAGECLDLIARVAPALERICKKSGIIRTVIATGGTATNLDEALDMAEATATTVLKYALGECQDDAVEIVAAINGLTVEELRGNYSGWQLVKMIKAVVMDKGFLSSARSLLD